MAGTILQPYYGHSWTPAQKSDHSNVRGILSLSGDVTCTPYYSIERQRVHLVASVNEQMLYFRHLAIENVVRLLHKLLRFGPLERQISVYRLSGSRNAAERIHVLCGVKIGQTMIDESMRRLVAADGVNDIKKLGIWSQSPIINGNRGISAHFCRWPASISSMHRVLTTDRSGKPRIRENGT